MKAFAKLLDRLSYTPSRNGKLTLMTGYFRSAPDPDRGFALAALTDGLPFSFPLRRAITEPAPDSVQARVMSAVAGGVSQAAHTLRDRSLSEMAADLRALAKRNPGVFAAGAAVAGFALARFLRASATSRHSDTPS